MDTAQRKSARATIPTNRYSPPLGNESDSSTPKRMNDVAPAPQPVPAPAPVSKRDQERPVLPFDPTDKTPLVITRPLTSAQRDQAQGIAPPESQTQLSLEQVHVLNTQTPRPDEVPRANQDYTEQPLPAPLPISSPSLLQERPHDFSNDMRYPNGVGPAGVLQPLDQTHNQTFEELQEEISRLHKENEDLKAKMAQSFAKSAVLNVKMVRSSASSAPPVLPLAQLQVCLTELLRVDAKREKACKEMSDFNADTRKMVERSQSELDASKKRAETAHKIAEDLKAENALHVKNKRKHSREVKMRKQKSAECDDLKLKNEELVSQLEEKSAEMSGHRQRSPTSSKGSDSKRSPKRKKSKRAYDKGNDSPRHKRERSRSPSRSPDREQRHKRDDSHHRYRSGERDQGRRAPPRSSDRGRGNERSSHNERDRGKGRDRKRAENQEKSDIGWGNSKASSANSSTRTPSRTAWRNSSSARLHEDYVYCSNRDDTYEMLAANAIRWHKTAANVWNDRQRRIEGEYALCNDRELADTLNDIKEHIARARELGHRVNTPTNAKEVEDSWHAVKKRSRMWGSNPRPPG
jgi:hypothetical protein